MRSAIVPYRVSMRAARPRPVSLMALVLAGLLPAAFVLNGCAAAAVPEPSDEPTAVVEPAFASDAEALEAATRAYQAWVEMDSLVMGEGGRDSERYAAVASGDALAGSIREASEVQAAGIRSIGTLAYRIAALQRADYVDTNEIEISFYVCEDLTSVGAVNDEGESVVDPNGTPVTPWQVTVSGPIEELRVSGRAFWTGRNYCE